MGPVANVKKKIFSLQDTKRTADKLGLRGWVMNTEQGTVVGVAQGPTTALDKMWVSVVNFYYASPDRWFRPHLWCCVLYGHAGAGAGAWKESSTDSNWERPRLSLFRPISASQRHQSRYKRNSAQALRLHAKPLYCLPRPKDAVSRNSKTVCSFGLWGTIV